MIICLTLLCGYAKAQTRGGDSSPPLPKEISAELFDKAVALIKEFVTPETIKLLEANIGKTLSIHRLWS